MKKSKRLTIIGSLLLLGLFTMPIWHITLEAPQYPDPIGMNIWLHTIADRNPNDIKNIDLLNHYIGMQPVPKFLPEFIIFPTVVGVMILFGLIVGFKCGYKWNMVWLVTMSLLGCAGMYDFYLWEKDYGCNLNEKAAIKFVDEYDQPMEYQPPLIGTKYILNFTAHSYPSTGVVFLVAGMGTILAAFVVGRSESKRE